MTQRAVTRPSVAPVVWIAAAVWAGSAWGEWCSWSAFRADSLCGPLIAGLTVGVACGIVAAFSRRSRVVLCAVLLGVAVGGCASCVRGSEWRADVRRCESAGAEHIVLELEEDVVADERGSAAWGRVRGGPLDGCRLRVMLPGCTETLREGRTIAAGVVIAPTEADGPWARAAARRGVAGSGTAWTWDARGWRPGVAGALSRWRDQVAGAIETLADPGRSVLLGVTLGDRTRLAGSDVEEEFRLAGLSHVLAVSGQHLALVCAAIGGAAAALGLGQRSRYVVTVVAGVAFVVLTGGRLSTVRALAMVASAGLTRLCGRRPDPLAGLAAVVAVVLVASPWALFDMGFRLSVAAVFGLTVAGSITEAWIAALLPRVLARAAPAIGMTLAAQLATTPIIAEEFGMLSLVAPVANVFAGPVLSLSVVGGLVGCATAGMGGLGDLILACTGLAAGLLARIAEVAAASPCGVIPVVGGVGYWLVCAAVMGLGWWMWPLPSRVRVVRRRACALATVAVLAAVTPSASAECTMVVLDVGQADAIVLQEAGRTMLVDAGADPVTLRKALARADVRRVDVLVLTHAHDDHVGGISGLRGAARVGWAGFPLTDEGVPGWVSELIAVLPPEGEVPLRTLKAGDQWRVGKSGVTVVLPDGVSRAQETNDTSVVLLVQRGRFAALLTGDAEEPCGALASNGRVRRLDILKVPHHGSEGGVPQDALSMWKPRYAIVSVGEGNRFGHPVAETIRALEMSGAEVLRTDRVGDITVRIDDGGYRVRYSGGGRASVACGRIRVVRRLGTRSSSPTGACEREGANGSTGRFGPEGGLPDSRSGGAPARGRSPPPERARCRRGGS